MNGFALRLVLKQRLKGIRKWPIHFYFRCSLAGRIRILNTEKVGAVSTVVSLFANLRPLHLKRAPSKIKWS